MNSISLFRDFPLEKLFSAIWNSSTGTRITFHAFSLALFKAACRMTQLLHWGGRCHLRGRWVSQCKCSHSHSAPHEAHLWTSDTKDTQEWKEKSQWWKVHWHCHLRGFWITEWNLSNWKFTFIEVFIEVAHNFTFTSKISVQITPEWLDHRL